MKSRSSGRRLLPARAVCPLPPRPEVFPRCPPRPTIMISRFFVSVVCYGVAWWFWLIFTEIILQRPASRRTGAGAAAGAIFAAFGARSGLPASFSRVCRESLDKARIATRALLSLFLLPDMSLAQTSLMPASSMTFRTELPATTPLPRAGMIMTRALLYFASTM